MNEAALLAGRSGRDAIDGDDLEEAMMRVIAGPERRSRVISDYQKRIIAYHEVGHALVDALAQARRAGPQGLDHLARPGARRDRDRARARTPT